MVQSHAPPRPRALSNTYLEPEGDAPFSELATGSRNPKGSAALNSPVSKQVCRCGTTVLFPAQVNSRTCWNCGTLLQLESAPGQGAWSKGPPPSPAPSTSSTASTLRPHDGHTTHTSHTTHTVQRPAGLPKEVDLDQRFDGQVAVSIPVPSPWSGAALCFVAGLLMASLFVNAALYSETHGGAGLGPFGNKSWSRHGLHWISFGMQMVMVCRTRMTFALANGYERGSVQFGSLAAPRTSMAMDARTVWRTRIETTMAWRTEWTGVLSHQSSTTLCRILSMTSTVMAARTVSRTRMMTETAFPTMRMLARGRPGESSDVSGCSKAQYRHNEIVREQAQSVIHESTTQQPPGSVVSEWVSTLRSAWLEVLLGALITPILTSAKELLEWLREQMAAASKPSNSLGKANASTKGRALMSLLIRTLLYGVFFFGVYAWRTWRSAPVQ